MSHERNVPRDERLNSEGYPDPTPYEAGLRMERERRQRARVGRLMGCVLYVIDAAGFHLENRLVLRDKRTGEVFD